MSDTGPWIIFNALLGFFPMPVNTNNKPVETHENYKEGKLPQNL